MRHILAIIIVLFASTHAMGGEPVQILNIEEQQGAISAHFSLTGTTITTDTTGTPKISPEDRLKATLIVTAPETYTVTLPTFSESTFGDFTLLGRTKINRKRINDVETSTSWLIEPYNEGEYSLPPLTISAKADKTTDILTLQLPAIPVISLPAEDSPFTILPARQLPPPLPWRLIIIIPTVLAIIAALIFVLRSKKRTHPLSPKRQALKELTALEGTSREKIATLSIIIRKFLDQNFTLRTSEKTYDEYAPFIKKHPNILKGDKILQILQTCDQGNYSGQEISGEELVNLIQATHNFIDHSPEPLRPEENTGTCSRW